MEETVHLANLATFSEGNDQIQMAVPEEFSFCFLRGKEQQNKIWGERPEGPTVNTFVTF